MRSMRALSLVALIISAGAVACSSSNETADRAPTVTVSATVTVTETAATTVSATTTVIVTDTARTETPTQASPPPTSAPSNPQRGLVWNSQTDPARINQPGGTQPNFDGGDGIVVRIDMVLLVDTSIPGDLSDQCHDQIGILGDVDHDTQCLYVQWAFDVPGNYRADEAGLSPGPLLTPAGRQIDQATITTGVPGAKNVSIGAMYPGGVPGSTLRWDTGSNKLTWKTTTYKVPGNERFVPIGFN